MRARAAPGENGTQMIAARNCMTNALAALLRDQPISPGKVSLAWRTAVGDAVARVTHVTLGPDGALTVTAADPQWTRELRRSRPLIAARLNRLLGDGAVKRMEISSRTALKEGKSHARVGHR